MTDAAFDQLKEGDIITHVTSGLAHEVIAVLEDVRNTAPYNRVVIQRVNTICNPIEWAKRVNTTHTPVEA